MKLFQKQGRLLLLAAVAAMSLLTPALAKDDGAATAAAETAAYLCQTVPAPQVGSVGGEWAVLGLARGGASVPEGYFETYYDAVVREVRRCGGILSKNKSTEYSRVILALTAIGKNPTNVGGYDLLAPLGDYNQVIRQGLNGPVFALLALDCGSYDMPQNPAASVQASREQYLTYILNRQLAGGGWALSGTAADPDVTAMVLQALAKYTGRSGVKTAVDRAVAALAAEQDSVGGYASCGQANSESVSQVITALCELGISPSDGRFVKNGTSLLDCLLSYAVCGGGFGHGSSAAADEMATEQALYALADVQRLRDGRPSLYRMSDAAPEIRVPAVTSPGKTFSDVSGLDSQAAIEALASRGILGGVGGGRFAPEGALTRAQFAAILVRALGLSLHQTGAFLDVPADAWYAAYADTAAANGLIGGVGGGRFNPSGRMTRQAAAAVAARSARLCGADPTLSDGEIGAELAPYADGTAAAQTLRGALAFCLKNNLLPSPGGAIRPNESLLRGEAAQMLYGLLSLAGRS